MRLSTVSRSSGRQAGLEAAQLCRQANSSDGGAARRASIAATVPLRYRVGPSWMLSSHSAANTSLASFQAQDDGDAVDGSVLASLFGVAGVLADGLSADLPA